MIYLIRFSENVYWCFKNIFKNCEYLLDLPDNSKEEDIAILNISEINQIKFKEFNGRIFFMGGLSNNNISFDDIKDCHIPYNMPLYEILQRFYDISWCKGNRIIYKSIAKVKIKGILHNLYNVFNTLLENKNNINIEDVKKNIENYKKELKGLENIEGFTEIIKKLLNSQWFSGFLDKIDINNKEYIKLCIERFHQFIQDINKSINGGKNG